MYSGRKLSGSWLEAVVVAAQQSRFLRRQRGASLTVLGKTMYGRPIHSYVKRHREMKQNFHLRSDAHMAQVTESMSCDGKPIAHVPLAASPFGGVS
jgi:hypothetical protein